MSRKLHVMQRQLAEQIKRAELAEAAGQAYWGQRYRGLAAATRAEMERHTGTTDGEATASIVAGYGNAARYR